MIDISIYIYIAKRAISLGDSKQDRSSIFNLFWEKLIPLKVNVFIWKVLLDHISPQIYMSTWKGEKCISKILCICHSCGMARGEKVQFISLLNAGYIFCKISMECLRWSGFDSVLSNNSTILGLPTCNKEKLLS